MDRCPHCGRRGCRCLPMILTNGTKVRSLDKPRLGVGEVISNRQDGRRETYDVLWADGDMGYGWLDSDLVVVPDNGGA